MKTYKNLFTGMLEPENVKQSIRSAGKGKSSQHDVKDVLDHIEECTFALIESIQSGTFEFQSYTTSIINGASDRKERLIAKPKFKYDQIMHHILMSVFIPIVKKGLYEHAYGSIPKRGPHQAKKFMEKWIRSYGDRRLYVLKCDIRHFYDSVDHNILKEKLSRIIKDEQYLKWLFRLIDSYEPGLPKGFYSSQWLANFYLKDFDHYIKQELGAKHYMRYMDDIIILCPNKHKLHEIKKGLESYLNNQLNLELKPNWAVYRFVDKDDKNGRDIDFMGFRFYRNKTTLRKSNLQRIRRKANKLDKKKRAYNEGTGQGITVYDAQSMLSYLGNTKHADVYGYFQKWIKPKVNPRQLRKKVSYYQRQENTRKQLEEIQKNKREKEPD